MDVKEIFKYINIETIIKLDKLCREGKVTESVKREPETVYDEYIGPFLDDEPVRQEKKDETVYDNYIGPFPEEGEE